MVFPLLLRQNARLFKSNVAFDWLVVSIACTRLTAAIRLERGSWLAAATDVDFTSNSIQSVKMCLGHRN